MTATNSKMTYNEVLDRLLGDETPIPVLPPAMRPPIFDKKPIPHNKDLTAAIAALQLHPCLESLLHILNADLASAHFYVRHMQSPPSYEGMILHALLHRFEGDMENARAWYGDIAASTVMEFIWDFDEANLGALAELQRKPSNQLRAEAKSAIATDEEKGNRRKGGNDGKEIENEEDPSEPGSKAAKAESKAYQRASHFLDRLLELRKSTDKRDDLKTHNDYAILEKLSATEICRMLAWLEAKYGTEAYQDASDAWVRPSEKIQKMAKDQMMGGEGWRDF